MPAVHAAPVYFGPGTTISGPTDVVTAGSSVYAYSQHNTTASTLNGVTFAIGGSATTLGAGNITLSGFNGGYAPGAFAGTANPYNALSTDYKNLIVSGPYSNGATAATITLNNLTAGHAYQTQIWVNDSRTTGSGRTETVTGANVVTLDYNSTDANGGVGQYATGLFAATGTSQAFTLQGNVSSQMNGIQLRDVTGIGAWTGTAGTTWDQNTSTNFATNLYSSALASATYNTARTTLGAVSFSDSYWDAGSAVAVTANNISVATGGVSITNVLFQNATLPYTVTSGDAVGLTGTGSVVLTGAAGLTLSGTHTYTGGTIIGAGTTLQVNGLLGNGIYAGAITNGGTLGFNPSATQTFSGVISGAGALIKTGTGTLALNGANTFTGAITVSAGALESGAAAHTNSVTHSFSGAGTVRFNGTNNGSNEQTSGNLSGNNSGFSGSMIANNARIGVSAANQLGAATVSNTGFGQYYFFTAVTYPNNFTVQGNGWGEPAGQLGAIRFGGNTLSGTITLAGDTRFTSHASTGTVSGPITESGGARALEFGGSTASTAITLSGTNSYTGGTTLNGSIAATTLTLNYATNDTTKLSDTGGLTFRGNSTLSLTGGTHVEAVASTTLLANSAATITRPAGTAKIALGNITRGNGATLNLGADAIATTTSIPTGGVFGSWMTVGGASLATVDGGNNIIAATYDDVPTTTGTITDGLGNVRVTGGAGTVATGAGSPVQINSISRTEAGLATVDTSGAAIRLGSGAVFSGSASGGLTIGTSANSGSLTVGSAIDTAGILEVNAAGGSVTLNSTITDNGTGVVALAKFGTGELILSGTNTYSGGSTFYGGIVRVNNNSALGAGAITIPNSTTLAGLSGGQPATTLANNFTVTSPATLTLGTGFTNFTLNGNISGTGNLATTSAGSATINGTVSHSGVISHGGGTLNLSSSAVVTGSAGLLVGSGTAASTAGSITFTGNSVSDNATSPVSLAVMPGATFTNTGTITALRGGFSGTTNFQAGTVTFSGDAFFIGEASTGAGTVNLSGGTLNLTTATADALRIGHWTTTGGNFLNVSGTSTLNAVNSDFVVGWDGAATLAISGGTVNLRGIRMGNTATAGTHGGGANTVTLSGGRLNLGAGGTGSAGGGAKTFNLGVATVGAFANWTGSAAMALTDAATGTTFQTLDSVDNTTARTITVSGVLSGAGKLVKAGAGTLSLTGGNTHTGTMVVNEGTVSIDGGAVRSTTGFTVNAGATFTVNSTNVLVLNHDALPAVGTVISVNGGNLVFTATTENRFGSVALSNGATWTSNRGLGSYDYVLGNTSAGAATVSVANTGGNTSASVMNGSGGIHLLGVQNFSVADVTTSDAADLTVSMTLGAKGVTAGAAGGVNKTGAGTMALTAAAGNTYDGGTTIAGGTVIAGNTTGSATGTGAVSVQSGATLAGGGSASGAVTVAGGAFISPGVSSIATLTTGALALGGTFPCSINGTSADRITVNGDLNLTGGTLNVSATGLTSGVVIASWTGTRTGTFASVTGVPSGYAVKYDETLKQIRVDVSTPFELWAEVSGLTTGNNAMGDNPDNDGLNNLGEFAFDGSPVSGVSDGKIVSKVVSLGGVNVLTLTLPVRVGAVFALDGTDQFTSTAADGVFYRIQGSDSLTGFSLEVAEVTGTDATDIQTALNLPALTENDDWSYRTFRLVQTVTDAPKGFLRAKVTN